MRLNKEHLPLLVLLLVSLLIGVFTFQDYGMTWDERLYYEYGEAIGYAYSVPARLSEDFDINRAYGPSVGDHRNRGPAYLLAARIPVNALHALTGVDKIDLWHLINFITYLLGVFYFYRLSLRWLKPESAFGAALLYISQPMLWGHAFINPKDPPFTTIFIATLYYGLRAIDQLSATEASAKTSLRQSLLVGILIGLATNIRIIAPLLGFLLFLYALTKRNKRVLLWFVPTTLISLLTLYVSWPYLWDAPIARFAEVLTLMSHNPTGLKVLFYGNTYRAYELPLRYLPVLLGITLTEPTWLLFIFGTGVIIYRRIKKTLDWQSLGIVIFYFVLMVGYVLVLRPPMYDGLRHFFFIFPPIFIIAGFAFDITFSDESPAWIRLGYAWLRTFLLFIVLAIGLNGGAKLHPYEYTYYNAIVGGTSGAEGRFETDYWLTCYKDAVEEFSRLFPNGATLIVPREAANVQYYAPANITVTSSRPLEKGNYLLLSARLNAVNTYHKYPDTLRIERDGATFCVIKEVTE